MDNQRDYYLLLGDLRNSTAFTPDQADRVHAALTACTLEYGPQIVAGLELNYGDEFAGLFTHLGPIYETVHTLRGALRGLADFRFVVAKGRIGTAAKTLREMGGPVFKTANDRLNAMKPGGHFAGWRVGNALQNDTLDVLTETAHTFRQAMTDYQYDVLTGLERGQSQVEIARALGKYEQSVSDAAKRGQAQLVLDVERVLRDTLTQVDKSELSFGDEYVHD